MDFFWYSFSESRIKPQLKMGLQRIKIIVNKKSSQLKHQKREIAVLLADNKTEKARIKVEHIIREDFIIESFELIELLCELLHERIKYIASEKTCPDDLKQAVCSLIWAIPRVDVVELVEVRKQLVAKYGKQFAEDASNNTNSCVNERLFEKLSVKPPSSFLVARYLVEIAKEYKVDWNPPEDSLSNHLPVPSPMGFSIGMAPGSELSSAYERPIDRPTTNLEPTYYPVEKVEPPVYAAIPTAPSSVLQHPQVAIVIDSSDPHAHVHDNSSTIIEKINKNDFNKYKNSNKINDNNNNINTNNTIINSSNNDNNDNDNNNDSNNNNNDNNDNEKIEFDELTARFNALK